MQRLKLYNQLDIQQSEGTNMNSCCAQDLESNDEDIELVESSFTDSNHLNEEERSTLYNISGHVAFKEKIGINMVENIRESEFLQLISRGKLAHPPPELFDFSLYFYSFFKSRKSKCCDKIFLQAYKLIYNYHFNNIEKINRRFFKAFVKSESDKASKDKNQKQLKKRKLNT